MEVVATTGLYLNACLVNMSLLSHCHPFSQGWGPRGLSSYSRTPRRQNSVALALVLNAAGLGLVLEDIPAFSMYV